MSETVAPIRSIPPSENTFETVMVDVTHRCNMACANCYLPDRTVPDMDIARLEDCLAAFPNRTNVRIAGAEPTLRRDLPEIIDMVRRNGHRAVLLTNGLRREFPCPASSGSALLPSRHNAPTRRCF